MFYLGQNCRHSSVYIKVTRNISIDLSSKFTTSCVLLCVKCPGIRACLICAPVLARIFRYDLDPFGVVNSTLVGTLSEVFD